MAQRTSMGFADGPPDGTIGVLLNAGTYSFYMSARSSASCSGTPSTEGTYRFGGTLGAMNQAYGCQALTQPSANGDPNGYTFDQDYAGGGPVLPITSGGQSAVLLVYHGEFHGGACANLGQCFYSSLGMAVSHDNGATFSKLGEIIQPYPTRTSILSANQNLDVGGGTMVLADTNGAYIADLASADPTTVYLYIFYTDQDPGAASSLPCNTYTCLAVARAKLSDIETAALAGNTAIFPGLFRKYYQGSFTQPATSNDPNAAVNSGHYTPVVPVVGSFPSVLYDASTQQYLLAYTTGNNAVEMRNGSTLLSWSAPIASGAIGGTGNLLYPTLVGEGADPLIGNGNPYLYYVRSTGNPFWTNATVISRRVQLSNQ